MRKLLLAGEFPFIAVLILCACSFALGHLAHPVFSTAPTPSTVAVAEKGAVILKAVLDNPQLSRDQMMNQIQTPILAVLQGYASKGFIVVDVSRDEDGAMTVAALPKNVIDITAELKLAVARAVTAAKTTNSSKPVKAEHQHEQSPP